MKPSVNITWNQTAIDQIKRQGVEHVAEIAFEDVKCEKCGTSPKLRQFGRYSCECGELEGVVNDR